MVKANKPADLCRPIAAQEMLRMEGTLPKAGTKPMEATPQTTSAIGVGTALREGLLEDIHLETNCQTALLSNRMDANLLSISRV